MRRRRSVYENAFSLSSRQTEGATCFIFFQYISIATNNEFSRSIVFLSRGEQKSKTCGERQDKKKERKRVMIVIDKYTERG